MDFKKLLCLSSCGKIYWSKMEDNIQHGCHYLYILKVNKVLSSLDESQIKIIKNNYKRLKNIDQLIDKLSEILVAFKYLEEKPLFFNDYAGKPDIFLQKTKHFIEVKKLNNSDFQKAICNCLRTHRFHISTSSYSVQKLEKNKNAVFKKAKGHIDKALKQLNNKNGLIYLIYSLDIIKSCLSEPEFINYIDQYFRSKATKISLNHLREDELFI